MRYTKRKKQKRFRRLVLFTLIVILLLSASSYVIDGFTSQYANISEKHSKYYSGQGQTKSYGKDGFTTTFKTSDGKEFKEYKQNDGSWENIIPTEKLELSKAQAGILLMKLFHT